MQMNIVNAVCVDRAVNGVPFSAKIIRPYGKANVRTLKKLGTLKYLVIHNTANESPAAGAENHGKYLGNVENSDTDYVSWHITVDSACAVQHLPLDEAAYHAGDGSGEGNFQSLGIEIAENADYNAAEDNALGIVCALMHEFGITSENVLPHRFFSPVKKLCPRRILKSEASWQKNWAAFQKKIDSRYFALYGTGEREPDERTAEQVVDGAIAEGILTDRAYWVSALKGEFPVNHEFVKTAFERWNEKINAAKK